MNHDFEESKRKIFWIEFMIMDFELFILDKTMMNQEYGWNWVIFMK